MIDYVKWREVSDFEDRVKSLRANHRIPADRDYFLGWFIVGTTMHRLVLVFQNDENKLLYAWLCATSREPTPEEKETLVAFAKARYNL